MARVRAVQEGAGPGDCTGGTNPAAMVEKAAYGRLFSRQLRPLWRSTRVPDGTGMAGMREDLHRTMQNALATHVSRLNLWLIGYVMAA